MNAVRLANALAERGHKLSLLVCSDEGAQHYKIDPSIAIHVAGSFGRRGALPRAAAMATALPGLRRRLRRLKPDILVSAGNHGHLVAIAASAGVRSVRRVFRISNQLDHAGDGFLKRRVRGLLHRLLCHSADRLMLVSHHLTSDPLLARAIEDGRALVTPNGVAAAEVLERAAQPCRHAWIGGDSPVIVSVGRLARHKNFATLIRAFAQASKVRSMKLLIIGGGSRSERDRLDDLVRQLGVADEVDFVGEVANPFPYVARASLFVLPSLWEGSSNALLEALACEAPIVASRAAGNAQEVLGYGRFGLLVDPMDVEGMAQAILYQTGRDPCRPGPRASDFSAGRAIERACAAVTARDPRRTVPSRPTRQPDSAPQPAAYVR